MKNNKKGISLIVLIITIVVLLIITTSVVLTLVNNNIINDASKAVRLQQLSTIKEEIILYMGKIQSDSMLSKDNETSLSYNIVTNDEIDDVVSFVPSELVNKIAIVGNRMFYIDNEVPENIEEIEKMGYIFIKPEDLDYVIELQLIENIVELSNRYNYNEIGKKLGQPDIEYIAGIGYGNPWNVVGKGDSTGINSNIISEIETLNRFVLTEEEKSYFTHSPYIVNYSNGAVLSIKGKVINEGTTKEIWTTSFNYKIGTSGFITDNLLSAVIDASLKEEYDYGEFEFSTTGSSSLNFDYEEDKYGNKALVLGEAVATLQIDQSIKINQQYTISILINGTTNQKNNDGYLGTDYKDGSEGYNKTANTIIAVSDVANNYVAWVGIMTNRLRIHSFATLTDLTPERGHLNIDVSEYDNKFMHIQIVAKKSSESYVYINGQLKGTYTGGISNATYKSVTLGDLRPGRGVKYQGNLFDVAIYGELLTEEQIQSNWDYVKGKYNLNDDGSQN